MAQNFASLRKSRNSIDRLVQESQKLNTQVTSNNRDERFWQPTVDKAGNGFAVVRFLPESKNEDLPWVRVFSHGFQGPGGWYIENSLTTLGQKDPCGELNSKLWIMAQMQVKSKHVNRNVDCNISLTSMSLKTQVILRTKIKFSCTNMARRFLIN